MQTAFTIILVIASIVIIGAVLLKEPSSQGLGSAYGSETKLFDMSGNNAMDALLNRIIVVAAVVFVLSAIIVTAL